MYQPVIVTVKRKDEARVRDLEVPANISAERLAELVARHLRWDTDMAGQRVGYVIEAHPLGRILQPDETLASAGVWNGSWLVFHPVGKTEAAGVQPAPAAPEEKIHTAPLSSPPPPPPVQAHVEDAAAPQVAPVFAATPPTLEPEPPSLPWMAPPAPQAESEPESQQAEEVAQAPGDLAALLGFAAPPSEAAPTAEMEAEPEAQPSPFTFDQPLEPDVAAQAEMEPSPAALEPHEHEEVTPLADLEPSAPAEWNFPVGTLPEHVKLESLVPKADEEEEEEDEEPEAQPATATLSLLDQLSAPQQPEQEEEPAPSEAPSLMPTFSAYEAPAIEPTSQDEPPAAMPLFSPGASVVQDQEEEQEATAEPAPSSLEDWLSFGGPAAAAPSEAEPPSEQDEQPADLLGALLGIPAETVKSPPPAPAEEPPQPEPMLPEPLSPVEPVREPEPAPAAQTAPAPPAAQPPAPAPAPAQAAAKEETKPAEPSPLRGFRKLDIDIPGGMEPPATGQPARKPFTPKKLD